MIKHDYSYKETVKMYLGRVVFREAQKGKGIGIKMIKEYLKQHRLITDGAMGTYYASLYNNENLMSEFENLHRPEIIKDIHKAYIMAGANLIRTNTFAANKELLLVTSEEQDRILRSAVSIAKEARKECEKKDVFITGDIGPIPESAETTSEELLKEYKFMIDIFLEEEVDAILFETFSDSRYLVELASYIKEQNPEIFVMTEFCLNKNGFTRNGSSAGKLLERLSSQKDIDALGFNCGIGPGHMRKIIESLRLPKNKYIMAVPNAGYPEHMQSRMLFLDNVTYFGENMKKMAEANVAIVGACCGTNPTYITEIVKNVKDMGPAYIEESQKAEDKAAFEDVTVLQEDVTMQTSSNPLMQLFESGKKVIAVELDPPFDANDEKIIACAKHLAKGNTDIITIADSPMGRSRIDSVLMASKLQQICGLPVMPHVCCRDKNMISMRSTLLGAYINDIRNLLVVTGDPVPNDSRIKTTSVFDYNSIRLMEYVKEMNEEHFNKEPFFYGGALNYGYPRVDKVIERMEKKMAAGAKYFLTQPIFSAEDIERIHYLKKNVDAKILCGIMPLVSYRNANFIKNEFAGIHVPDDIVNRYHPDMSKEEAEVVGAQIASEIIEQLSDVADGYYFMLPFNRVSLMDKIKIK